jgi:hypothetical protein
VITDHQKEFLHAEVERELLDANDSNLPPLMREAAAKRHELLQRGLKKLKP